MDAEASTKAYKLTLIHDSSPYRCLSSCGLNGKPSGRVISRVSNRPQLICNLHLTRSRKGTVYMRCVRYVCTEICLFLLQQLIGSVEELVAAIYSEDVT